MSAGMVSSLAAALPPPGCAPLTTDDVLARFVDWVASQGLALYPAQEEAILELLAGKHVVLSTPTGSGKSLVAMALVFKALSEGRRAAYTCPVKALVNEKFFALCQAFGADRVGLMTGDATVNRDAPVLCCTAEILSRIAASAAADERPVDSVVMDEFHYYADRARGAAWQIPLLAMRDTGFLLMSATLGDTTDIERRLAAFTGREVVSVRKSERPVPLTFEYKETPLHETIADLVTTGRYPIYLVNFTQRAAAAEAQNLLSVDFSSKEEKDAIKADLAAWGARFDSPYGKDIQKLLRHGVGLHHAGLLPRYRLLVEKLAQGGRLKVVSGTDTLGVGVNIPIRTVLLTQLCKFDGEKPALLTVRELVQIAGRAGRKGFDERGWAVAQAPEFVIENRRLAAKAAAGKKVVKQKPPTKGYVHWDRGTFDRLTQGAPEPLESRFAVTHGLLLGLVSGGAGDAARGGGYRRLLELCARSHGSDVLRHRHKHEAARVFRTLRRAGLVELAPRPRGRPGRILGAAAGLQRDFSLDHTLSLYLLDTLPRLDPHAETYALDVLTLVESILESPQVILFAQIDRIKGELVDRLKADGVEYEQRMEALEKVEHPKPLRGFIYDTFNVFAERHPWVGTANIRPKSIAREMMELCCTFADYVRDYGIARSEGVLLRYLTDAYKTLARSVPDAYKTAEVDDIAAHLGAMVRAVDSSLLDEWGALRGGGSALRLAARSDASAAELAAAAAAAAPKPDLAADQRALYARIRADLHRLTAALARKAYEDAAALIQQPPDGEWPAARIEAEMAPYFTEHADIDTTPAARHPSHTFIKPAGPRQWLARHKLMPRHAEEGDDDWMIETLIDLREPGAEDRPLLALRRIGT